MLLSNIEVGDSTFQRTLASLPDNLRSGEIPMHRLTRLLLLLPVLTLASCTSSAPAARERSLHSESAALSSEAGLLDSYSDNTAVQNAFSDRKIIHTAFLTIEVENADSASRLVDSMTSVAGGLVADIQLTRHGDESVRVEAVLRVPSSQLQGLLTELRGLGEVSNETIKADDITMAYQDLETRIAVKETTVERLNRLLANRTGDLSDVLNVERELSRVVTELEQMKGQLRYYSQQIALATVNVSLLELGASESGGVTEPIVDAFAKSLEVLSTSIAGVIYLITFLLPWAAVASLIWWIAKRFKTGRRA